MGGLKVSTLGPQIGENLFLPLKFLGGKLTYEYLDRK